MKYLAYLIVLAAILFNLWLNFPETQILADPNDNIFQYSLVFRTNWVWKSYGCPFSLSCLPNLTDHVVTAWAEGYPLPLYYSHIPQIVIVGSYNMLITPLTHLFGADFSLYQYYNFTKYLLYALFPIPVFFAFLVVGFPLLPSAIASVFASHLSTDGLYGIDPVSQLWRGYGLTSQLYAVFFLPLAIAFIYKLMSQITYNPSTSLRTSRKQIAKYIILSAFFLILTTAGHLGIGMMALLSMVPFIFFDLKLQHIIVRGKRLLFVIGSVLFVLSYWILPILLADNYHMISFWDPIWKFNSYGAYEVIRQFLTGEIFDWGRFPIITGLILIGFFSIALLSHYLPFAILFVFWILLYFGRTTWGPLIDLIPGMKDFHLHRFIVAVHMAGIFLLPAAFEQIYLLIRKIVSIPGLLKNKTMKQLNNETIKIKSSLEHWDIGTLEHFNKEHFIIVSIFTVVLIIITYFTIKQTYDYTKLNNRWIGEANSAYKYDEQNFKDLTAYLNIAPNTRIYAGRRGNWGNEFKLGSTQIYMLLGVHGFDMSQFLPETWSPLSENEQNFDERLWYDYDLLNLGFVISPKRQNFADEVKLIKKFGPFEVYKAPTTGWFDVVVSPMFVKSDKTNFVNIVHLWHRSYARLWKMHPLISVEKKPNIPDGMQKVIEMTDEVTYQISNSQRMNIFSDYPFVFPQATVSGKIISEQVKKQVYKGTIDVPENCSYCYVMFKMSYHPNWQVKVDGQPAQKFAVFPFYLATPVTTGTHEVEFYYEPSGLKVVLIILEIIIISGVCVYLLMLRRRIKNYE